MCLALSRLPVARGRQSPKYNIYTTFFAICPKLCAKSRDSNKCSLADWPSLFNFERKIACAEKERHGHERTVDDAEKFCKVSQAFAKDSLVKAVFTKIGLTVQQKNHRATVPSKFST